MICRNLRTVFRPGFHLKGDVQRNSSEASQLLNWLWVKVSIVGDGTMKHTFLETLRMVFLFCWFACYSPIQAIECYRYNWWLLVFACHSPIKTYKTIDIWWYLVMFIHRWLRWLPHDDAHLPWQPMTWATWPVTRQCFTKHRFDPSISMPELW